MPSEFSYLRYLEAKRSVDDRALNRVVLGALRQHLAPGRRLRILELGGGTGSMVRRCLEWSILDDAEYHLIDEDAEAIAALPSLLMQWQEGNTNARCEPRGRDRLRLGYEGSKIDLHLVHADINDFLAKEQGRFDLIIANAVLDLVDITAILPRLWACSSPGGLYWFTINFDGESVFLPPMPGDATIFEAYHASMDRRVGSRHTGRSLFAGLAKSGATILECGSSDWVVHAENVHYRSDESYFLHHIIHTIDQELGGPPTLDSIDLQNWVAARHEQVERGELSYIAHQLDFVGVAASGETI